MLRNNKRNDIEEYRKAYDDGTHDKCYGFVHNVKCLSVNNRKKGVDDLLDAQQINGGGIRIRVLDPGRQITLFRVYACLQLFRKL